MKFIERYFLGIDAGGSKTEAAIGTISSVLGYGKSGSANAHVTAPENISHHIREAIIQALASAKLPPSTRCHKVVIGMAGIDSVVDHTRIQALTQKVLHEWVQPQNIQIVNDIEIVRRSGTQTTYGLALISGTGSHGMGINPQGEVAHVSGVEYLLADEGSGYDIGLKALRATVRSADGRTKPTALERAVLKYYKVKNIQELIPLVYTDTYGKSQIAELATLVGDIAAKGDWRAKEILRESQDELVLNVQTLVKRLRMQRIAFELVVVGGIFQMNPYPFLKKFTKQINQLYPKAQIIVPKDPPVLGALRLAQA